jgi:CTD kinase subunit gamma
MQFLSLINRLNSSLASIQKVSSFALTHPKCADDIWDCLVEECDSVSLNARINLLYFLDTLLDKQGVTGEGRSYAVLVKRDLAKVVDLVVPQTREGVLNLMAANQVRHHTLRSAIYVGESISWDGIDFISFPIGTTILENA